MKYLLLFLLIIPGLAYSQISEPENEKNFSLGIVPQYAIVSGFRVDLDFKLNDKNHWILVAPQLYINNNSTVLHNYNNMFGAGLELQHKIYLKKNLEKVNFYLAYGPTFNYFSVAEDQLLAENFTESGSNYIKLVEGETTTNIYKLGGNLIMGIRFIIGNNLYMETYIGSGIRLSFDNKTDGLHKHYDDWWGDMGYSGTLMVGGYKFGITF
ncbi:MAG: hypothetical protein CSA36_01715 [Draconibacterium sp.]|nr:MAG: hypothetical protein CSA36_01715 [Draconibacterium sp.]